MTHPHITNASDGAHPPAFIKREPGEVTPHLKSIGSRVVIITYAATDPEKTPPAMRGMAKCLIDGKLAGLFHHGPTPEIAAQELANFLEAQFEKLAGAKPRGRKPKAQAQDVGDVL